MIRKQSVVLTALAFFAVTPAYALDFDALLNAVLGNTNTFNLSDQASLKTTINERQAQLEAEMNAGAASGYLTTQEQAELRNQLNHAGFMEGSYLSDGNLSRSEVRSIVEELNQISRRLQVYIANGDTTGYANPGASTRPGNRWGNYNDRWRGRGHRGDEQIRNQAAIQAGIDTRQAQIDASITTGLSGGRLSSREARRLRTALNEIASDETHFMADGRLSYTEELELTTALTSLEGRVRTELASAPRWDNDNNNNNRAGRTGNRRTVATYRNYLSERITTGLRTGKLSQEEARKLNLIADQVRRTEAVLFNNNMHQPLHFAQETALLNKLDSLNNQITSELNDNDVW